MDLQRVADLIEACFRDAGVFSRQTVGAGLIEAEVCTIERARWLVACAGIGEADAANYFKGHPGKQDRAVSPLRTSDSGQLSFLFVVRPFEFGTAVDLPPGVTDFAPGNQIPYVEYRNGSFFRASNLDGGEIGVEHFRWELDIPKAHTQPREEWLRKWFTILGENPAHPASHLHVNSPPLEEGASKRRDEYSGDDLRLAVAPPNPLALVLSFAAWLRAGPSR